MADEPTKETLLARAAELDIEGRSSMTKDELAQAIARAEAANATNAAAAVQTDAQAATEALEAVAATADEPSPPDVVGRPELVDVAADRAKRRESTMRVIGSPTQEA